MWDLIVSVPDHCLSFYLFRAHFLFHIEIYMFTSLHLALKVRLFQEVTCSPVILK